MGEPVGPLLCEVGSRLMKGRNPNHREAGGGVFCTSESSGVRLGCPDDGRGLDNTGGIV